MTALLSSGRHSSLPLLLRLPLLARMNDSLIQPAYPLSLSKEIGGTSRGHLRVSPTRYTALFLSARHLLMSPQPPARHPLMSPQPPARQPPARQPPARPPPAGHPLMSPQPPARHPPARHPLMSPQPTTTNHQQLFLTNNHITR